MFIIGIDPGVSGAIATLNTAANLVTASDLPTSKLVVSGKKRNRIDMRALFDVLSGLAASEPALVVLEEVQGRAAQSGGVTFGKIGGAVEMALVALQLPHKVVAAGTWKPAMGLSKDKELSRREASRWFPACAGQWPLKGHDGRAEAALLAKYGQLKILGAA